MFDLNDPDFLRFLEENGFIRVNQGGVRSTPPVSSSLYGSPLRLSLSNVQGSPTNDTTDIRTVREGIPEVPSLEPRGLAPLTGLRPSLFDNRLTSTVEEESLSEIPLIGNPLTPPPARITRPLLPFVRSVGARGLAGIDSLEDVGEEDLINTTLTPRKPGEDVNINDYRIPYSLLYGGIDLPTSVFKLGQSLAFDENEQFTTPEARQRARTGNALRLAGSAGKTLFNLARFGFAGAGFQNRLQSTLSRQQEQNRRGLIGNFQIGEDGLIVMERGGEMPALSLEEVMTGEYMTGLPSFSLQQPNAEVEHKEFVIGNDGTVQQVVGKNHAKGGEKVALESGTKVISNNLKIGKDNAKYFKENYGVEVKAGDTFATVVDKYTKKLGLNKLNDEQVEYFTKLKKQEDVEDLATAGLNTQFLSKKIKETEDKKRPLEQTRSVLAEDVFRKQQISKGAMNEDGLPSFRGGGVFTSADFNALVKRHNLTREQGLNLIQELKKGGVVKKDWKYQDGDEVVDPVRPFVRRRNVFNDPTTFVHQSVAAPGFELGLFGNVNEENLLQRIDNLRQGFPLIVDKTFDLQYDDQGNLIGASLKEGKSIENFQKEVDNNYELLINETAQRIDDPALRQDFIQQVTNERFNNQVARGFDNKFGNFTSSRPNFGLQLVTPEDLVKLQEQGITSFKQLLDKTGNIDPTLELDPKSLENLKRFVGTNANFLIGELDVIEPQAPAPGEPAPGAVPGTRPVIDEEQLRTSAGAGNLGGLPFLPDQSVLPPGSIEPHLKITRRFDRIQPVAVSPEQSLVEIARNEAAARAQINTLPGSQRTAALTNLSANSQLASNQAIAEANRLNAQSQFAADQVNIQQSNLEEQARAQDLLDFEKRQLTAKAITEENLNNYFDFNRRVRLGNFNTLNRLDLLNQLFENFGTTPYGTIQRNAAPVIFSSPLSEFAAEPIQYGEVNVFSTKKSDSKKANKKKSND